MITLTIILVCIYFYFQNKKYKESSYYQVTNNSFLDIYFNKGKYGEYLTYKQLQNFEESGAKFLFNMYIAKDNGETTEADLIMICKKGIIVFESKNYSGWIFGDEKSRMWMQTLPTGKGRSHKEQFFNPILQNKGHINYLKKIIEDEVPMYSVIVFSERCSLKKSPEWTNEVKVIRRPFVYDAVNNIFINNPDKLTQSNIWDYYGKLYKYSQATMETKIQHIQNIRYNH